jgi:hypothetical protein
VFHVEDGSITDPGRVAAIEATLGEVRAAADVTAASDPFDPQAPAVSSDGTTAFSTVYFDRDTVEEHHTVAIEEAAESAREAERLEYKPSWVGASSPATSKGTKVSGWPSPPSCCWLRSVR